MSDGVAQPSCNSYVLNRLTPYLVGWDSGSGSVRQVKIYEVSAPNLATATSYSEFSGKDLSVSSTPATSLTTGTWYVMSQRSRTSYVYEDASSHTLKHTQTAPLGSDKANYPVRLLGGTDGKYFLQTGLGNYVGQITGSTNVPTTALGQQQFTIEKIASTDGHFYVQCVSNNVILDANDFTKGDPATVVGWGTNVPTSTGGNNDWAFYPIELVESWVPTASEVYTINNTNSGRGALIYNPDASTKWVWSSGKSGTFDANQANSQWVICPTGTDGQYYLYNVGAQKFAVPTNGGTYNGICWKFSYDAAPVALAKQDDGTYKIYAPYGDRYMSVSNNYTGPIINYNDIGANFTITKVGEASSDVTTQVTAAVNRLVGNITPLTATSGFTTDGGWYVIELNSGDWTGHSLFTAEEEITYNGTNYPIGFYGYGYEDASIANGQRLFRITKVDGGFTWQMSNGKYLYNPEQKFPLSTTDAVAISIGKTDAGFSLYHKSTGTNQYTRYATAYNLSSTHFIGETATTTNIFDIYPANLTDAGLAAWQIICDGAPETTKIACSRSDVSGLTSVYKNGYIFLPTGVTPESTEFTLDGATSITVDADAKTVTLEYDPNLAIVADGIEVSQGWQTAGRDGEVMLLRVNATPFADATGATLNVSLLDGAESNISALTLYEASSDSPEILSAGNTGAPTKTQVSTTSVSSATATLSIGNLTAGAHYYWLGATVKSTATLGAVIDAAVTGITYTRNSTETTLDLTAMGNPADRGAMVFNAQSYPFLPWDNGSHVYRIPAMVVADDGSIIAAVDKRYNSHTDIGNSHVIDIVVRRSTDGGKTWGSPVVVAKGDNSNDATCGYGDPSLYKDNDGKLYLLFAAGNTGYFYGLKRVCLSTSSDNGATWTTPVDLYETGKITDHATSYGSNTCYGLYDYFVTSGRGLCTSEGYLMGLLPAQAYTKEDKTEKTSNSHDYIFYSTDKGATWHISENAIFTGGDEAKIIQANDGSLIASVRQGYNRGFNTATYTANGDGTLSFTMGTQWNNSQLSAGGAANNQDIFYYQRSSETGKTDVIFHSMTTGKHANLKLYYSTDGGSNWTEFLNVQTKGTRYVTMERSGSEENPGSLYLLFEDQSLNAAGDNSSANHYPINFLEITREQLETLIPTLDEYNVPEYLKTDEVKVVYGTTSHTTYGSLSGDTWTSNASSGVAGLTLVKSDGTFNLFSNWNDHYNIAYAPATADTPSTLTLNAPEGYIIKGYSLLAAKAYSTDHTYTLTAEDGTSITPAFASSASGYTALNVSNVNAASTTISVTTTDVSKYVAIADFTVTLAKTFPLNVVGDESYATLYLPFDVTTTGATKAYYATTANNGSVQLTETAGEGKEIPARTAVVLVNSDGAASTILDTGSGLTPAVSESDNLLKGTLVPMSLDLGDATPYYAMGKKDGKIGFYKFNNGGTTSITLGANKSYLETTASANAVKGFAFDLDPGDETALKDLKDLRDLKDSNDLIFNLAGQRLSKPLRGINIIGGKKVLR